MITPGTKKKIYQNSKFCPYFKTDINSDKQEISNQQRLSTIINVVIKWNKMVIKIINCIKTLNLA